MSGIFTSYEYTVACSSDAQMCGNLFSSSSYNGYWGTSNKNDYAMVRFTERTFRITGYELQSHGAKNMAKGILVEGIEKDGNLVEIDRIEESTLTSSYAVQKRNIRNKKAIVGVKFSIFDTWDSSMSWYSGLYKIKVFGSFNKIMFSCQRKARYIVSRQLLLYTSLVFS